MTSIILLMMMRDGKADAVFARCKAAMHNLPSFEVQVAATNKQRLNVKADFVVDGSKRLMFDATTDFGRYVLTITPSEFRDVDWGTRSYDIFPWHGRVGAVVSRISIVPTTIPFWLAAGDLRVLLQKGSTAHYAGKQTINGESCDVIKAPFEAPGARGTVELAVAPSGYLYHFNYVADGVMGHKEFDTLLKDYKPLKSISASRFENRIPDGFTPYSVTDHFQLVPVGKKPNFSGWADGRTGKEWSAPRGQAMLFVLTSPNSTPGQSALGALASWRSELKAKHVAIAEASDAKTAGAAGGLLYDPDQRSIRGMDVPATPLFFLLDSGGTIRNMWMGFTPTEAGKMHDDLLKAVAELK